jgi:hypothetical protein
VTEETRIADGELVRCYFEEWIVAGYSGGLYIIQKPGSSDERRRTLAVPAALRPQFEAENAAARRILVEDESGPQPSFTIPKHSPPPD